MNNNDSGLHITAIILSFFIGFLIITCIMEKNEPSIEEQIQICKRNGGTPNVHIDKEMGNNPLVCECSWKE